MIKPFKLFYLLLLLLVSITTSKAQKSNPSTQKCIVYTFDMIADYGCGNFKFQQFCEEEFIWNWGDGTIPTTTKNEIVMHQYCKTGTYMVTIRLAKSPNIIRDFEYVTVNDVGSVDFTYTILSQSECDKSIVEFNGLSECLFTFDVFGDVIPGSDELEWDFGDGTTSRDVNVKHTYTSGGDFVVTLKAISSPCEFQKSYTVHLTDAVTCCLDNFLFTHVNWSPSGINVFANRTISVKEELHLYPGDYLELNSVRLEMGKDAKIVIERGAKLKLINSTITTTTCGGYVWEGIEVWGSGDFVSQERGFGLNGKTGNLEVWNSTIENADEAISVTKKIGLGFFETDKSFNGGFILVNNSTFRNNYTSINMWPYKGCADSSSAPIIPCDNCFNFFNISEINNNTFICNAPMRDARYTMTTDEGLTFRLGVSHFVYMNTIFSVKFLNNDFKNLYFSPPVQYRGIGVRLIHSNIDIKQTVPVKGFRGLTVGILTNADNSICKTTKIMKNNFVNCQVAIDANSTKLDVSENVIYIPNTTANLITQGIITRGCKNFGIYTNSINGLSTGKKYGILLKNNRTGTAKNNNLIGLFTGTQSELLNEAININCNYYQNQNYSIVVPNGKIGPQGSKTYSAGNIFVDNCKPASSNVNHIKSNVAFDYYYFGNGDVPICKSIIVNSKGSDNPGKCNNLEPCPPICTRDNYVQRINAAISLGNIIEANALKSEMATELLSMAGGYEVYLGYLESIAATDLEAAKILASTYLTEGKLSDLQEKLDIIQQSESEEGSSFVSLMSLLKEAQMGGRDINDLSGEEVLQLNDFAQNDTTTAGYIAEGLLYQIYGYEYDHNPFEVELGGRIAQIEDSISEELKLYPNPAKESITIMSDEEKIKEVKIYNIMGELVLQAEGNSKSTTINTKLLPNGIYYSIVYLENSTISRKFIIE